MSSNTNNKNQPSPHSAKLCEGLLPESMIGKPLIICEGSAGVFYPELSYVQQGSKVLMFRGQQDASLCESITGGGLTLVESIDDLDIVESAEGKKIIKEGKWFAEGPFQRSDVENANKRSYPRSVWERIVADSKSPTQARVKNGDMLGLLEHPADGRTDGNKGAIKIESLELKKDGVVWGKLKMLDTPAGKILKEYTREGVRWGVSSRGHGSLDAKGMIGDDYRLETFDAVMKPSTPGAFPTVTPPKGKVENESQIETTKEGQQFLDQIEESKKTLAITEATTDDARIVQAKQYLDHFTQANSLAGTSLSDADTRNVMDWLAKQLGECLDIKTVDIEALIESAIEERLLDNTPDAALQEVMQDYQSRIATASEDNQTLRETNDAKGKEVDQLKQRLESMKTALREAKVDAKSAEQELKESYKEVTDLQGQVEAASVTIQAQSEAAIRKPLEEAVEAVLSDNPQLMEHEELFYSMETYENVQQLATALLRTEDSVEPQEPRRRTMPRGSVGSEGMKRQESVHVQPLDESVRMARSVIANM